MAQFLHSITLCLKINHKWNVSAFLNVQRFNRAQGKGNTCIHLWMNKLDELNCWKQDISYKSHIYIYILEEGRYKLYIRDLGKPSGLSLTPDVGIPKRGCHPALLACGQLLVTTSLWETQLWDPQWAPCSAGHLLLPRPSPAAPPAYALGLTLSLSNK